MPNDRGSLVLRLWWLAAEALGHRRRGYGWSLRRLARQPDVHAPASGVYFVATRAVSSPSRTLASEAMLAAVGSLARFDQICRARAVSPAIWYVRAALAR